MMYYLVILLHFHSGKRPSYLVFILERAVWCLPSTFGSEFHLTRLSRGGFVAARGSEDVVAVADVCNVGIGKVNKTPLSSTR